MRLASFAGRDRRLGELVPGAAPSIGTVPTMATAQPQSGQPSGQQSGLATGQMDPAQAAQAAQSQQEQKKQIQDQIRATEQQLVALRKQMAEIG